MRAWCVAAALVVALTAVVTAVPAGAATGDGTLQGTATALHTGRGAAGICVDVFDAADRSNGVAEAMTAPDGTWSLQVPAGDYVVAYGYLEMACVGDFERAWSGGATDAESATPVTVTEGGTTTSDIVLTPGNARVDKVCVPTQGEGPPPPTFSDVPSSHPFYTEITCAAYHDIVQGRSDGTFGPALSVTRGQVAAMVARMITSDITNGSLPADAPDAFTDDNGSPFETYINQLADVGIVGGKSPGAYGPNDPVTRGQMASILLRSYDYFGLSILDSAPDAFTDDNGSVHEEAIDELAFARVVAGRSDGTYGPSAQVTRGQMAAFVSRVAWRVNQDLPSAG